MKRPLSLLSLPVRPQPLMEVWLETPERAWCGHSQGSGLCRTQVSGLQALSDSKCCGTPLKRLKQSLKKWLKRWVHDIREGTKWTFRNWKMQSVSEMNSSRGLSHRWAQLWKGEETKRQTDGNESGQSTEGKWSVKNRTGCKRNSSKRPKVNNGARMG